MEVKVLRFSDVKRETNGVFPSTRSTEEVRQESAFRRRALLRPRARPSPVEAFRRSSVETLEHEVRRSRRFGHSFFLACIPCPLAAAEADGWHNRAAALLASLIRDVDNVWVDGRDVYILLPESDRAMGTAALERIREPLSQVLPEEACDWIPSVVFAPDECPTSGALLSVLHRRVRYAKARTRRRTGKAATLPSDPDGTGG